MEIFVRNSKSKYSEVISLSDLENINKSLEKFSSTKGALEVKIFVINVSIQIIGLQYYPQSL